MLRSKSVTFAAALALAASGCTASRYQISDALGRYGLSPSASDCAANFLHGHLSTSQVDRLARAARYYSPGRQLTFGDLVAVASTVHDGQVTLEVGAAALACGVAGNIPLPRF